MVSLAATYGDPEDFGKLAQSNSICLLFTKKKVKSLKPKNYCFLTFQTVCVRIKQMMMRAGQMLNQYTKLRYTCPD